MATVMVTKLSPPRIENDLITRPRLMELFDRHHHSKLLLITAPAGYGKTVAALQFAEGIRKPYVWYQLDRYDNDPAVFMQYLIAGISRRFPGFGAETLKMALQANTPLRLIVISFINELANLPAPDLLLILEDYHVIFEPVIHQFCLEILEHLPAGIRFILTTRTTPPFDLSRYRVKGQMDRVDSETLRFTPAETSELLTKRRIQPVPDLVDGLMAKTNGWPAALKLMTPSTPDQELTLQANDAECLYDFLANEVLDQQPAEIREFLVSTSALATFSPEICDHLLDRNDSQAILETLERQQLFLIPLTGQTRTYRYHQLFREFLLERLGPRKSGIYRKAAEIALQSGDWDQAFEAYRAAGSDVETVAFLKKAGKEIFRQGQWQTVERWLGVLERTLIETDPWLALFRAKISASRGRLAEAEKWAEKSLSGFTGQNEAAGVAECRFIQAKIANRNGLYTQSIDLLEKAYPVLQKSEPSLRFELPLEKALIYIRMGRLQQAEAILLKGLQVAEKEGDSWITAHFMEGLGNAYYMMGETNKALEYYRNATRLCPGGILPGYCADFTGFLYQELGDMDRAFAYLHESIARKEEMGLNEALLPAYFQLSGLYADIGQMDQAEAVYQKAAALIAEIGGERFFLILLKVNLGRIRSQQGQLAEAQIILEQILAESQSEGGVALIMGRVFYSAIFLMSGNLNEAEKVLIEVMKSRLEFAQALTQCYFLMASVKFLQGDMLNTAKYSRKLLEYSSQKNFEQMFVYMFDNLQPVVQFGLTYKVEVPFIQRVLILLEERGLSLLGELAVHKSPAVRARIIFPLSQIKSESAAQLLQTLAHDADPRIRRLVHECVAQDPVVSKNTVIPSPVAILRQYFPTPVPAKFTDFFVQSEAAPLLRLHMLGPARIIYGRTDLSRAGWRFTKSRDLLLYLAHRDNPVGINQLLEDLWPDVPLEKGMNLFYNALHWLRQTLEKESGSSDELVIYKTKICSLVPERFTTDRNRFLTLISEGRSHPAESGPDNLASLEDAVTLYEGDYLSQLDYPWVVSEREHLKRLYLEAAIHLSRIYIGRRNNLKAVRLLSPLAEANPLREELSEILMTGYAGLGDKAAVIRQYATLKKTLDEELGLEPAPDTTRLYYQLCGSGE